MRLLRRPGGEAAQQAGRVTATVNYATEKARVTVPEGLSTQDLITTVERAGYTATLPEPPRAEPEARPEDGARSVRSGSGWSCRRC
jgi:hypothetical protein